VAEARTSRRAVEPRVQAQQAKPLFPIAGVLLLVGAEAFMYGYSYPYFSLSMHRIGLSAGIIGLNASAAGVGILFLGPFVPGLIARFGLRKVVIAQFSLSTAGFMALLASQSVAFWFGVRFVLGAILASIWSTTEIWLNMVVSDKYRGRVLGISGSFYAVCQFLGPLTLGIVGVGTRRAVLAGAVPLAAGAVLAIALRQPQRESADERDDVSFSRALPTAFRLARVLLVGGLVTGIGEAAMESLLPLYGLSHRLGNGTSARLVAAFSAGEAALAVLLGWLADRHSQKKVIVGTMLVGALSAGLIPLVSFSLIGLVVVLVVAGGTIPGIYTLAVVLMGKNFTGDKLAVVSVGFATTYSIGSVIGPTPVGYMMRVFGANSLPLIIAMTFLASALMTMPSRTLGLTSAPERRQLPVPPSLPGGYGRRSIRR
jgi:MFS family permease